MSKFVQLWTRLIFQIDVYSIHNEGELVMNAKTSFDSIMLSIEKQVAINKDHKEIATNISNENYLSVREMNSIIAFLTGFTLVEYIKERKLMAAYKILISDPIFDIDAAIEVSGYDNQSSFTKKFTDFFGISPKVAHQKKESSKYKMPLSWEAISVDSSGTKELAKIEFVPTKFGIPKMQYDRISEAMDYQLLYEFTDIQSEAAFQLLDEYEISVKDAFEFIDEYTIFFFEDVPKEQLEQNTYSIDNKLYIRFKELYFETFNREYSVNEINELNLEGMRIGVDIAQLTPYFWKEYFSTGNYDLETLAYFGKIYDELSPNCDLIEFIQNIRSGMTPQEAATIDYGNWEDYVNLSYMELNDPNYYLELEADEELDKYDLSKGNFDDSFYDM